MLAHEDSRIQDRKLILWARFHPEFSRNVLIPEIEENSMQYHVAPQLVIISANAGMLKIVCIFSMDTLMQIFLPDRNTI